MIAALAALAMAAAAQAQPQTAAPTDTGYPAATDGDGLIVWLRAATDLAPEQVVAVTPSAATAIVARAPAAGGRIEAQLRAVAITPQAAARSGVLAWEMKLEVDCKAHQVRPGATIGYANRRAESEGIPLAAADTDWRQPKPNTTLDASMRAVCDANFQRPLVAAQPRIAQAQPGKPAPVRLAPVSAPAVTLVRSTPSETQASSPPARLTHANVPISSPVTPTLAKSTPVSAAPAASRPVRSPPAMAAPVWGGHAAVQVVSSPVEAETRKKLASLQRRFGPALQGAETRVEPAQVNGRTVYRGIVAGFSTRREASAFCQTLKQGRQDCLAR